MSTPQLVDTALWLAARGFAVFPLRPRDKRPATRDGFKSATKNEEQIRAWWTENPEFNVGIATGAVSGTTVVDIDGLAGEQTIAQFALPDTLSVRTPGKPETGSGRHLYFRYVPDVTIGQGKIGPHVDHRGDGGYVVAAGSIHPSGGQYTWASTADLAEMPAELVSLLREKARPAPPSAAPRASTVLPSSSDAAQRLSGMSPNGGSILDGIEARGSMSLLEHVEALIRAAPGTKHLILNNASWAHACAAHEDHEPRELSEPRVSALLLGALAQNQGSEVIDWAGASATVASAFEKAYARPQPPKLQPWEKDFSEDGLARRFAINHRGACAYVPGQGWRVWDQMRWGELLGTSAPTELASQMLIAIEQDCMARGEEKLAASVKAKKTAGTISAILKLAQRYMSVPFEEFNRDPFLLNCRNGTVDLRTGVLRHAQPDDKITHVAGVAYPLPEARPAGPEGWLFALSQMQRFDQDTIEYLRLTLGSFLYGEAIDGFTIFYGGGFDGKSTVLQILHGVLGEYARAFSAKAILTSKSGVSAHTSVTGGLAGARLGSIDELPAESQLDTGAIKATFGRLPTRVQTGMGKAFQDVTLSAKLLIATNHLPRLDERDRGTVRRTTVVPFDGELERQGVKRDDTFAARLLAAEGPAILAWLVSGCRDWLAAGRVVARPARVEIATQDFVTDDDLLGRFLETCSKGEHLHAGADDLYKAYVSYAEDAADYVMSKRAFGNRMREQGFKPSRAGGKRIYMGVAAPVTPSQAHARAN